jgi:hypothetical protein
MSNASAATNDTSPSGRNEQTNQTSNRKENNPAGGLSGASDSPLSENQLDKSPLPGPPALACMTRSVSLSNFGDLDKVIENCGALVFPSASPSEDELSIERERKEKAVKRKRQILAFVIICLLVVGGVIIEKIRF